MDGSLAGRFGFLGDLVPAPSTTQWFPLSGSRSSSWQRSLKGDENHVLDELVLII